MARARRDAPVASDITGDVTVEVTGDVAGDVAGDVGRGESARKAAQGGRGAWDLEDVCLRLADGQSYAEIAAWHGRTPGALGQWLAADAARSARARQARSHAAQVWDQRAFAVIEEAVDSFTLARAKELASHYRWRAAKASPDYSERVSVAHSGVVGTVDLSRTMDEAMRERVALEMLREAGYEFETE